LLARRRGAGSVGTDDDAVASSSPWSPATTRIKAFTNALGGFTPRGKSVPGGGPVVALTAEGARAAAPPAPPSTGDLQRMVFAQMGPRRTRRLQVLIERQIAPMTSEELAGRLGEHPRAKAFTIALGSPRSLGVTDCPAAGQVSPATLLFLDGR
jgi:hypothetical protein